MDTYTGITIAFLILSVFILSCRCYYACCYRPTPKLNTVSVISTQPPPSYDAAMASSPNQNTNQTPQSLPQSQATRNVAVSMPVNNYSNIYQPSRASNPSPTVHASTYAEPASRTPSWQLDPSKAGKHKFQLPPPSYKP